jgi:drug/metabolite transporter (DMT)-like permease
LLLFAAMIWGCTFVVQKWAASGPEAMGPLTFTGARFLLGGLMVLPLAAMERRRATTPLNRKHVLGFIACGLALLLGAWTQQAGVAGTSVANAGFLTSLYVAMVPILAWTLFGRRPHPVVWPAIGVCLAGTWLLTGAAWNRLSAGDGWVLACAGFWAVQVTLVGVLAAASERPLALALVQYAVGGIAGCLAAAIFEAPTPAVYFSSLGELLWAGLASSGIAFTLQVVTQRYLHPATAAIVMSAESVFAALSGALILGERMSGPQCTGAALILAAILAVETVPLFDVKRWLVRGEALR